MTSDFGRLARLRGVLERRALRLLLGTKFVCTRLAASRRAPLDGRTLDPEIAAMLRLDDLMQFSDVTALSTLIFARGEEKAHPIPATNADLWPAR